MFIQRRCSILYIIFLVCFQYSCTQKGKDYPLIFGDKYSEAENFFKESPWITDTLEKYGIDPQVAISIVFPEVIRYSALRDLVETHSLEVLYTQIGRAHV